MANLIPAFSYKGFAIKLADSSGWFKVSETTPVMFFLRKGRKGKEKENEERFRHIENSNNSIKYKEKQAVFFIHPFREHAYCNRYSY
jgi:hypothetical protein